MSDQYPTQQELKPLQDLTEKYPFVADIVRQCTTKKLNSDVNDLAGLRNIKSRWTVAELAAATFPDPKWAVPGIIPVGVSFLAGRPKLGKSWLALQVAHAVGTGGRALGEKVELGKVLYLALEDSPRRLKNRIDKQGVPVNANITFETTWKPFPDGGLIDLGNEITIEKYSLVIIDTLSRAIGRADQLDQAEMTTIIGNLQQLAINADIAILLIDHHRKSNGDRSETSPIDDILGSTAKAAVADAALGLYREQGKRGAVLKIVGRDMEEKELSLEWDGLTCCWQNNGDASGIREDSAKADVITAIRAIKEDGKIPTTARVAKFLKKNEGYISHVLADLVASGKVSRGLKVGKEQPYEAL